MAKEWGAKGLAYLVNDGGELRSPIAKFLSEDELAQLQPPPGHTTLFVADEESTVSRVLGGLRLHLARVQGYSMPARSIWFTAFAVVLLAVAWAHAGE